MSNLKLAIVFCILLFAAYDVVRGVEADADIRAAAVNSVSSVAKRFFSVNWSETP